MPDYIITVVVNSTVLLCFEQLPESVALECLPRSSREEKRTSVHPNLDLVFGLLRVHPRLNEILRLHLIGPGQTI